MIYHKNLQRVAYVFAETAGRPPADVVVDILADEASAPANLHDVTAVGNGWIARGNARPVDERTFFANGSHLAWSVPAGFTVDFAGEYANKPGHGLPQSSIEQEESTTELGT